MDSNTRSQHEPTLLDLHPVICERAVQIYFEKNVSVKEAIEQAKKEYEGVIE